MVFLNFCLRSLWVWILWTPCMKSDTQYSTGYFTQSSVRSEWRSFNVCSCFKWKSFNRVQDRENINFQLKIFSYPSRPEVIDDWHYDFETFKISLGLEKFGIIFWWIWCCQVSVDGNTTISTLHYTPAVHEDGKSLRCRSENPNLPGSVIENVINLEVRCK